MRRLLPARRCSPASHAVTISMVDVLTVLLLFLLRAYSTDPPASSEDPGFELPTSASLDPVDPARTIEITQDGIYMDGNRRTSTQWYLEHSEDLVREIYTALQQSPHERLLVRADRETPYRLVRKVLFTAQQAGFSDITLVAQSRSSL
ncbi:MAG: biopolymer transporter ExbD [Myxococcota bacterium]|nr:biopolymer transporter ExbD [Myxococcota bacterium]